MNENRRAWQTFWLAAATIFMVSVDTTVVVAAFPALRAHFSGTSAATLSWMINAYSIVFAALLVPAGRLVDQYGHRRCFLLALAGFTLASAACACATGPGSLTVARVFKAAAAAMLAPSSLALILAAFPQGHRSRLAGLWSAAGALGAALGPVIGSLLIEWFSWRMIFLINLPFGIAVLGLGKWHLQESRAFITRARFDAVGTLLLIAGFAFLAAGLTQAGKGSWATREVIRQLVAGIALIIGFIFHARGRQDSALNLDLFADLNYRWASAATLILGMAFGMMFLAFYLFFIGVWHYSQSMAGIAAMPGPIFATALAMIVSKKQLQWGQKRLLALGGILFAASNFWLSFRISPAPQYLVTWLPGQILGGIAIGLMLPSIAGTAVASLQSTNLGVGSAVNNAIRQLGSSLGVAITIALVGNVTTNIQDFRTVYLCLSITGLLIALLAQPLR